MTETPSLPRRPRDPEPSDFDALRAEGIRWLERMTGDLWSDYNLHDPGITVLEHLCYGLTEVLYWTDFDIADHLTGPSGEIDAARQLLHPPEEILPCRPSTPSDYRALILSGVEEVDDVRILPWPWREASDPGAEGGGPGVYRVILRPSGRGSDDGPTILRRVHRVLSAARTLGEDVALVTLAERDVVRLAGDVEIAGARPLAEILTDVYTAAEDHVRGRLGPAAPETEEFGPRPAQDPDYDPERIFVADLRARIQRVEGVAAVSDLRLVRAEPGEGRPRSVGEVLPRFREIEGGEAPRWSVPWIELPEAESPTIRLWRRGRPLPIPPDFAARYRAVRGGLRIRPEGPRTDAPAPPYPAGRHRPLARYRSVQGHFPALYGINGDGMPEASDEARLGAYRLKSWMMLAEQILADHLVNLHHLRDLFSLGEEGAGAEALHPTYRVAPLGPDEIPGWERFFGPDRGAAATSSRTGAAGHGAWRIDPEVYFPRALAPQDDAMDRRSRLQDHLLAVFGETFAPRHRRDSGSEGAVDDPLHVLIRSRTRLLEEIPAVTRDRAGGEDLLDREGGVSGFHRRVALMMGIPSNADFHVIEHVLLRPRGSDASSEAWRTFHGLRVSVVFPGWVGRTRDEAFRRRAEEVVARCAPAHVHATCHWLGEERMAEFSERTGRWRDRLAEWSRDLHAEWSAGRLPDATALDAAAAEVSDLLRALVRGHDG